MPSLEISRTAAAIHAQQAAMKNINGSMLKFTISENVVEIMIFILNYLYFSLSLWIIFPMSTFGQMVSLHQAQLM